MIDTKNDEEKVNNRFKEIITLIVCQFWTD